MSNQLNDANFTSECLTAHYKSTCTHNGSLLVLRMSLMPRCKSGLTMTLPKICQDQIHVRTSPP